MIPNQELDGIKARLEKLLGSEVRPDVWRTLVRKGHVEEIMLDTTYQMAERLEDLAEMYKDYEEQMEAEGGRGGAKSPETIQESPPDGRLEALSRIIAARVTQQPKIVQFRRDVLGDRLLAPEEIGEWISRTAEADGKPTVWLSVALPDGTPTRPEWAALDALASLSEEEKASLHIYRKPETLQYYGPDNEGPFTVNIRLGGTLWRLKLLTIPLRLWWTEPGAATFILTGVEPRIPKSRVKIEEWAPHYRRVVLNLDPRLSGQEVASLYNEARQGLFQGRDKPMSEKHLALAVFVAERAAQEGTWMDLLTVWNQTYPEWSYPTDRWQNFNRDARNAYKRVTGTDLRWKSASGKGVKNNGKEARER
jgi:hypothetical protein